MWLLYVMLDVSMYAYPSYPVLLMQSMGSGLEARLDVSSYSLTYPSFKYKGELYNFYT